MRAQETVLGRIREVHAVAGAGLRPGLCSSHTAPRGSGLCSNAGPGAGESPSASLGLDCFSGENETEAD